MSKTLMGLLLLAICIAMPASPDVPDSSARPATASAIADAKRQYNRTNYNAVVGLLKESVDPDALRLLGQSYFMLTEYKKATDTLDRAVTLQPNNSDNYLWLGRVYGRRAETAFAVAAPGLASKARTNLEKAVALNPQNWEAVGDLFEYYLDAPGFLGGGADKAERLTELIAAHDPAEAAYSRARIAEHRKDFTKAESHLRQAAQLAPHQVGRILDLARFLSKRGRFEESDRTFEQATRRFPNVPKVLYARARALIESNRNLPEARELLKEYLSSNLTPDDAPRQDAEKLLRKVSGS